MALWFDLAEFEKRQQMDSQRLSLEVNNYGL
jgi:hypothetical protein